MAPCHMDDRKLHRECRYVFSADVAQALVETNTIAPLKFMPNEDATFGFWVMGMDLRHVDQPKVGCRAGCKLGLEIRLHDVLGMYAAPLTVSSNAPSVRAPPPLVTPRTLET